PLWRRRPAGGAAVPSPVRPSAPGLARGGRAHALATVGALAVGPGRLLVRRLAVGTVRLAGRPPADERQHAAPLGLAGRHLGRGRPALEGGGGRRLGGADGVGPPGAAVVAPGRVLARPEDVRVE